MGGDNIGFLIVGPSGSGKSTVIQALVQRGIDALDLDDYGRHMIAPPKGKQTAHFPFRQGLVFRWVYWPATVDILAQKYSVLSGVCDNLTDPVSIYWPDTVHPKRSKVIEIEPILPKFKQNIIFLYAKPELIQVQAKMSGKWWAEDVKGIEAHNRFMLSLVKKGDINEKHVITLPLRPEEIASEILKITGAYPNVPEPVQEPGPTDQAVEGGSQTDGAGPPLMDNQPGPEIPDTDSDSEGSG